MSEDLKYRTALVTGASHGIGRSIALALADHGASIIACGRNHESLCQVHDEVLKRHSECLIKSTHDATDPREVERLFCGMTKLDILVNNIGGAEKFGSFFDLTDEDWDRAYHLNFMTMVYFSRAAIPFLRRSDGGRIINIASLPAHQPGFFNPHYSAAKAAMVNLSKHLANILARDNILVNVICPSSLKGGGWERNIENRARGEGISVEEAAQKMESDENAKSPLRRMGMPEDVAELVAFLASDRGNFITGTCIDVDGGISRSIL